MGKPVIMGRVTWEGLPFPLPGRDNLVVTRNPDYMAPEAQIHTSLDAAVARGKLLADQSGADEVMIIGGAKIYETAISLCDRMYVTCVDAHVEGDAAFPEISDLQWKLVQTQNISQTERDDFPFEIKTYERKTLS